MTRWQNMKLDLASALLKSGQDAIALLNDLGEEAGSWSRSRANLQT